MNSTLSSSMLGAVIWRLPLLAGPACLPVLAERVQEIAGIAHAPGHSEHPRVHGDDSPSTPGPRVLEPN